GLLEARGLILLTDVDGILAPNGLLIESMGAEDVEARIASGDIHGGMIPKARGAVEAANASGAPTTITSWKRLALLSGAGRPSVGTRILPAEMRDRPTLFEGVASN
ncbi:MAG: hypothetical protein VYC34_10705, partial [Planctomycetota bacterium]|nr:hypothetical protein [Planctomycetota bacterium]